MISIRHLPIFLLIGMQPLVAQIKTPFTRGVNLTGWFQADSPQQIQFTKYSKEDFEQIKSLNCDVIRLPIKLHEMTGGAPDYTLDPLFLNFLDQATDWAVELNMHLIFDNHTFEPYTNTSTGIGSVLEKIWLQMAQHFKDRPKLIYYEILNEPQGISPSVWNDIQYDVVKAIRTVDTTHTIIVSAADWSSYKILSAMPVYDDDNLIYTFHFEDPYLFTHQGVAWVVPSMEPLTRIPFPYSKVDMPPLPAFYQGTWVASAYNDYPETGTVDKIHQLLDIAIQFRDQRQVPVYCGQFGTFIKGSDNEDRVLWYQTMRQYLEEHDISWTMWDYHGGFGVFNPDTEGLFNHDLNVSLLQALGLNVPPQTPLISEPDTTSFFIYDDYLAYHIFESSNNSGILNYYSENQPNNDKYCINWSGAFQYEKIGFDFRPNRDLTNLVARNYALDFFVRGDTHGTSFDVRFIDSNTDDPADHPWRSAAVVDESRAIWDNKWHQVHIPLVDFGEQGAWENNTWYDPQGNFDWGAIDRLDITAERGNLQGVNFWFDNIQITRIDSSLLNGTREGIFPQAPEVVIYPNPVSHALNVKTTAQGELEWLLADPLGRVVRRGTFIRSASIQLPELPKGVYFFQWKDSERFAGAMKVMKY
jgi:endoglucanase